LEQDKREKEYRDKLNRMNSSIFENGKNQLKFFGELDNNTPFNSKDLYNVILFLITKVSNDIEYNLNKVAEHELQHSLNKKSQQNLMNERLKSLYEFNTYVKLKKDEKLEDQKKYKEILDSQVLIIFTY